MDRPSKFIQSSIFCLETLIPNIIVQMDLIGPLSILVKYIKIRINFIKLYIILDQLILILKKKINIFS